MIAADPGVCTPQDEAGRDVARILGRTKKLQLEMAATGHPCDDNSVLIHFLNGLPDEYKMEKKMLVHQGQDTPLRWDAVMPML